MAHGEAADIIDLGRTVQITLADGTRELFFKKIQKPLKNAWQNYPKNDII